MREVKNFMDEMGDDLMPVETAGELVQAELSNIEQRFYDSGFEHVAEGLQKVRLTLDEVLCVLHEEIEEKNALISILSQK